MTCKDCVHYKPCFYVNIDTCGMFKDKSKFIELPCKVGDIVFCLVPQWVIGSESNEKAVHKEHAIVRKKFDLAYMDYIGKNVFLTYEAAEAALKEREQNE